MNKVAVLTLILSLLSASDAFAKRSPPALVAPVRLRDIELRVPHSPMGCVEAWDVKRNELIWRRQIYAVKYTVGLERDVQDVFIQSIELKDDTLIVKNERKSEYQLDLDSLQVAILKGSLAEKRQ